MKTFITLFLLLLLPNNSNPFDKFIKIIPSNWAYEINNNNLIITRKDSIEYTYCSDVSPIRNEPVRKKAFSITVEAAEKLSQQKIKRRLFLQDSILAVYQKDYDLKSDKITYGNLNSFKYNKNLIDTLRIPFHTNTKYSYYFQYNIHGAFCIQNKNVSKEIIDLTKMIYTIK